MKENVELTDSPSDNIMRPTPRQDEQFNYLSDRDYFSRTEVSNSDLSRLKLEMLSSQERMDFTNAYRMGTLIDQMITEPHNVNYFKRTCLEYQYTVEEFETCERMKEAFRRDEFCKSLLLQSTGQMIMSEKIDFHFEGLDFAFRMRCKYDLWSSVLGWGGDIKSTTATTQKQFLEAVRYFDYDRQRACYMTISGAKQDMIIGISKVNYKIFKVPITRDGELFLSGIDKLTELAFKWWCLFENFSQEVSPIIMASHDKEHDIIIVESK